MSVISLSVWFSGLGLILTFCVGVYQATALLLNHRRPDDEHVLYTSAILFVILLNLFLYAGSEHNAVSGLQQIEVSDGTKTE